MADFCKDCSIEIFGSDTKDHAGLSKEEDTKKGLFCTVICEDCGVTQVDHEGICIGNCLKPEHNIYPRKD